MRRLLLTCGLAATCLTGGFASEANTETKVVDTVKALRANDMKAAATSMLGSLDDLRELWNAYRELPGDPMEDAEFNGMIAALTNPEMLELIVQQARASVGQFDPEQVSAQMGMLPLVMMSVGQYNPELTQAPELQMVMGMIPDLQTWIRGLPLNDADTLEKTVRAFAEGITKLEISTVDDLRALELDALFDKANMLTATIKEIAPTYNIDFDEFLDSIKVTSGSDDSINVKMLMLGKERSLDMQMVEQDGVMVPKIIVEIEKAQAAAQQGQMGDMMEEEMPEAPSIP